LREEGWKPFAEPPARGRPRPRRAHLRPGDVAHHPAPRPAAPTDDPQLRHAQEDAARRRVIYRPGIGQVLGVR